MDSNTLNKEKKRKNSFPVDITRREIINQEQPVIDSVEITIDPNAPETVIKPEIMQQYDQAKEPSPEVVKLRNYKKRQMQEFTSEYTISRILPSGWSTFLNVINTIILTIALIIAFLVAFGLILGYKIGIVPSDSMEPRIHVGSLVVIAPLNNIDEIRIGDVLSYYKADSVDTDGNTVYKKYIHEVQSVGGGAITMVGANPDYVDRDIISFDAVEGRMILNIPYLGYVIAFVQANAILVISIFVVLIIALMLARALIDHRHSTQEITQFLSKKAEYERVAKEKLEAQRKIDEQKQFNEIISQTKIPKDNAPNS